MRNKLLAETLYSRFAFCSQNKTPQTQRWCSSTIQRHRWDLNPCLRDRRFDRAKPQCLSAVVRLHGVISFKSSYGVVFKRAGFAVQRHTNGQPNAPVGFEPRISGLQDRYKDTEKRGPQVSVQSTPISKKPQHCQSLLLNYETCNVGQRVRVYPEKTEG